jgi:AcrR family transcriptional regulator
MGRPSLAAQRREQILDAMTRCVGEYGLEGATLERVAEASGFSRGHIRHYLGNREEMIRQFEDRLTDRYIQRMRDVDAAAGPGERGAALVQHLFGEEWAPNDDNGAINALMWAAARNEQVREHLRATYLTMERIMTRALSADYPQAPAAECAATAYTLVCLAFAHSTLMELAFPASRDRTISGVTAGLLSRLASWPVPAAGPPAAAVT